ncbi:hypothetical protein HERIO_2001 [Hepatospora eriocheir]|uniref:Uncharacterized protein n=1 Tax=Hepatospora eriocheir TaxID=1081669 RepID=A0A1X0Q8F0_9MICR|nr:hypothetical protein HERIO_2001 [Hepatospora eriocheir]
MTNEIFRTYIISKQANKIAKEENITLKFGRFNKFEKNLISKCVTNFCEKENLQLDEFKSTFLKSSWMTIDITTLIWEICDKLKVRTYAQIYNCLEYIYHPYVDQRFSEEDNRELLNYINENGVHYKNMEEVLEKHRFFIRFIHYKLIGRRYCKEYYGLYRKLTNSIPNSEEEIKIIANEFDVSIQFIKKKITEVLKGKLILEKDQQELEFMMSLLYFNHIYNGLFDLEYLNGIIISCKINQSSEKKLTKSDYKELFVKGFKSSFKLEDDEISFGVKLKTYFL